MKDSTPQLRSAPHRATRRSAPNRVGHCCGAGASRSAASAWLRCRRVLKSAMLVAAGSSERAAVAFAKRSDHAHGWLTPYARHTDIPYLWKSLFLWGEAPATPNHKKCSSRWNRFLRVSGLIVRFGPLMRNRHSVVALAKRGAVRKSIQSVVTCER